MSEENKTPPGVPAIRSSRGKRQVDQRIKRRVNLLKRAAPWLQPSDGLIIPRELAKLRLASDEIHEKLRCEGYFDENGDPKPGVDQLRRLALAQARLAAELGLTVRSRVEIQSGSRLVPVDATFEARVEKVHAEMHNEAPDKE